MVNRYLIIDFHMFLIIRRDAFFGLVPFNRRGFNCTTDKKIGCQNKTGVLLLLYLLFIVFFYCCLQMLPQLGTPLQILGFGWMGSRKRLPSHHKQAMRSGSHQDAVTNRIPIYQAIKYIHGWSWMCRFYHWYCLTYDGMMCMIGIYI